MKIEFIGQGYNLDFNNSVAEKLIEALSNTSFNKFKCLIAFASKGGVTRLASHIENSKKHITEYKVIVGIDQEGTSKEALEELIKLDIDTFIYYTPQRIIFHPKIYLLEGDENSLVIIGSNNFTKAGLLENIEASVAIEIDKKEDDSDIIDQIYSYFSRILESDDDVNLKPLTSQLIGYLVSKGIVPTEAQRRAKYYKQEENELGDEENDVVHDPEFVFTKLPIQKAPKGFVKRSVERITNPDSQPITEEVVEISEVLGEWSFNNDMDVLVAEISKGDRWKQANFDVETFENFFGATAGDNNYHIQMKYVSKNAKVNDEIEISQAVTVRSSNYRFELRAASGILYPDNGFVIGVFIKIAPQMFLYTLIMPDDDLHEELNVFLGNNWKGGKNRNKRIVTQVGSLEEECPNLPFWQID